MSEQQKKSDKRGLLLASLAEAGLMGYFISNIIDGVDVLWSTVFAAGCGLMIVWMHKETLLE